VNVLLWRAVPDIHRHITAVSFMSFHIWGGAQPSNAAYTWETEYITLSGTRRAGLTNIHTPIESLRDCPLSNIKSCPFHYIHSTANVGFLLDRGNFWLCGSRCNSPAWAPHAASRFRHGSVTSMRLEIWRGDPWAERRCTWKIVWSKAAPAVLLHIFRWMCAQGWQ